MLELFLGPAGTVSPSSTPVPTKRPGGDYSFSEVGSLLAKGLPCCCCFDVGRTEIAKHLLENQRGFIRCFSVPGTLLSTLHVIILLILIAAPRGGFINIPISKMRKRGRGTERLSDLLKVTEPEVVEPGLGSDALVLDPLLSVTMLTSVSLPSFRSQPVANRAHTEKVGIIPQRHGRAPAEPQRCRAECG